MKHLFLTLSYFVYCEAKKFDTCDLAKELNDIQDFPKSNIASWVCLAEHASGGDTKAISLTPAGIHHYGLFQLPQRTCEVGGNGGDCQVACQSLIDDDIKDATKCALKIFEDRGFYDWLQFNQTCQDINGVKQKLADCGFKP
ncbi:lysozyme-like [Aricia agestis]|uniref:lysozyme-like n=1 Tax=Aricia agestis TaxID=91739 RepID=UPI001C20AD06|nr:lysozyme-like [Aricia agestis]